jgi:hypothetical protein
MNLNYERKPLGHENLKQNPVDPHGRLANVKQFSFRADPAKILRDMNSIGECSESFDSMKPKQFNFRMSQGDYDRILLNLES